MAWLFGLVLAAPATPAAEVFGAAAAIPELGVVRLPGWVAVAASAAQRTPETHTIAATSDERKGQRI
jgi:hypothetical protein